MKIGIIILNYLVYEDTINCVNSIKKQDDSNVEMKIIIVDNNSNNNSGEILEQLYNDDNLVEVVRLNQNLGFANGNNEGYKVLLKHMKPDFVIVANDDILIEQPGLFEWIKNKNIEFSFGILGPSIYSSNQKFHQSPMKNYSKKIYRCRISILVHKLTLLKLWLKNILRIKLSNVKVQSWGELDYKKTVDNLTLHGSLLVFSDLYFTKFDLPFDGGTYLYLEEYILKLRCDRARIPMIYAADYEVVHLQGSATTAMNKNQSEYMRFRAINMINSLKRYMQLLQEL